MKDNHGQFLQWPLNSVDLSPIENVWNILKNAVEKKSSKKSKS